VPPSQTEEEWTALLAALGSSLPHWMDDNKVITQ